MERPCKPPSTFDNLTPAQWLNIGTYRANGVPWEKISKLTNLPEDELCLLPVTNKLTYQRWLHTAQDIVDQESLGEAMLSLRTTLRGDDDRLKVQAANSLTRLYTCRHPVPKPTKEDKPREMTPREEEFHQTAQFYADMTPDKCEEFQMVRTRHDFLSILTTLLEYHPALRQQFYDTLNISTMGHADGFRLHGQELKDHQEFLNNVFKGKTRCEYAYATPVIPPPGEAPQKIKSPHKPGPKLRMPLFSWLLVGLLGLGAMWGNSTRGAGVSAVEKSIAVAPEIAILNKTRSDRSDLFFERCTGTAMQTEQPAGTVDTKRSAVEGLKEGSRWLRGTLADELASDTDSFSDDAKQLLKFHGSYQQEDRDARKDRSKAGVGKHYMMMIRLKLPGGKMTAAQYLAMDDIAGQYANGTLRFTTRQSIQFHGVLKSDIRKTIQEINAALVSTLGACGDVNRNVMACPAPIQDQPHIAAQKLADDIAAHLAPRSNAYHDVWLNGEKLSPDAEQADGVEPIYGKVYLPRKFKTAIAFTHDNCVDIYANDLGFLANIEHGKIVGYNVTVGGGFGRTSGNANTFPHLAQSLCYVEPDEAVDAAEAVLKFFRDTGNRADRKRARLKYVIHDWGIEKVREVFARDYWKKPIQMPKSLPITGVDLHHGWHPQGDGKLFLGLSVENGRVKDEDGLNYRTGLRKIVSTFNTTVYITGQQDVILGNIDPANRDKINAMMAEHGIPQPETLSMVQRWSMACPAIPTCGLAITESERTLPILVDDFETMLTDLGLQEERVSIRMTGCPNGCARPYNPDIGLVGRSGEKYTLFVGGSCHGDRLNFVLQDLVPRTQVMPMMRTLLEAYQANRAGAANFGDWCHAQGVEKLCTMLGLTLPKPI